MIQQLISLLLILSAITFAGCGKYPGDVNKFYKGVWSTDTAFATNLGYDIHSFVIIGEANSSAGLLCEPSCTSCACFDYATGKAKVNKKQTSLRVGSAGRTMLLKITKPPYQNANGQWVMEIDNTLYFRR